MVVYEEQGRDVIGASNRSFQTTKRRDREREGGFDRKREKQQAAIEKLDEKWKRDPTISRPELSWLCCDEFQLYHLTTCSHSHSFSFFFFFFSLKVLSFLFLFLSFIKKICMFLFFFLFFFSFENSPKKSSKY